MLTSLAVLFDMDGVLVNSEPLITQAGIQALREYGVTATIADFLPFTGMGEDRFIGGVAQLYGIPYVPQMKQRAYELYLGMTHDRLEVYEGTKPLLKRLSRSGIPFAVASSADGIKVDANLRAAGIDRDLFAAVLSGDDVRQKKPDPEIYLEAAKRCGVPPRRCIVVEDAQSGVEAALRGGMRCIGVQTSFTARQMLDAGCAATCANVSGVWDILTQLPVIL